MSISRILADLRAAAPVVAPSLLSCDFAELREEIRRLEQGGARLLHVDIMDGHFVPNLSIGVPVVEAIRRSTALPLDVHLMISEPGRYLRRFREAGADMLTFHIEADGDPRPLLQEIRGLGAVAGISLNPPTPAERLDGCLDLCDLVLVMGVMPGFGGQAFDPVALSKLRRLRDRLGSRGLLSVDGGVNADTVGDCAEAGADLLVTGSALFSHNNYGQFIDEMTGLARAGRKCGFSDVEYRVDSSRFYRLRCTAADSGKPGYPLERTGLGRGPRGGGAVARPRPDGPVRARFAALPANGRDHCEGLGDQAEEGRIACRTSTRVCGRGCWWKTFATSSRRFIASGRSSRRTSARRKARCSARPTVGFARR